MTVIQNILKDSLSLTPIAEGKTKQIYPNGGNKDSVFVMSTDDITARNGAKHDVIPGKGRMANETTCNVFRLLQACGIPVAFDEPVHLKGAGGCNLADPDRYGFKAPFCTMLPYEVVLRREAHGSYLKRAPHLKKGHIFPQPIVEFFLKTNEKKWKGHELICDDPLMVHDSKRKVIELFDPQEPNLAQSPAKPFLTLSEEDVFSRGDEKDLIEEAKKIARKVFLILEKAWQLLGYKISDFKLEFGISHDGRLLLADVVDNDSWRVLDGAGNHVDKQIYRNGASLDEVAKMYQHVAERTGRFGIPAQQLILWYDPNGSYPDQLTYEISEWFPDRNARPFRFLMINYLIHKDPERVFEFLRKCLSEVPDTVIVAFTSNTAVGALLSNTSVPVITVPAGYQRSPDNIVAFLHTPDRSPAMMVLDPANAVLSALQLLAIRNPAIYARLQIDQGNPW